MRRPVLESTTAKKILHFSELDLKEIGQERVQREIAFHMKALRKECQKDGWLVLRVDRLLYGNAGDIQLVAKVVKLGVKPKGKEGRDARKLGDKQRLENLGRAAAPPEAQPGGPEAGVQQVDARDDFERSPGGHQAL